MVPRAPLEESLASIFQITIPLGSYYDEPAESYPSIDAADFDPMIVRIMPTVISDQPKVQRMMLIQSTLMLRAKTTVSLASSRGHIARSESVNPYGPGAFTHNATPMLKHLRSDLEAHKH